MPRASEVPQTPSLASWNCRLWTLAVPRETLTPFAVQEDRSQRSETRPREVSTEAARGKMHSRPCHRPVGWRAERGEESPRPRKVAAGPFSGMHTAVASALGLFPPSDREQMHVKLGLMQFLCVQRI